VRQANVKVILGLTGSQCNSDRRAVAGIVVTDLVRLREQLRSTHVVSSDVNKDLKLKAKAKDRCHKAKTKAKANNLRYQDQGQGL